MNIILSGAGGHMGREVIALTKNESFNTTILAGVDPVAGETEYSFPVETDFCKLSEDIVSKVQAIVDFSHHSATKNITSFAISKGLPLVIATTGQTQEELDMIKDAAKKVPVFFASNYSMGIALLVELAKKTAQAMPEAEIEIVEVHHDRKVDAPSGTAITLAKAIQEVRPESNIVTGRSGLQKRQPNDIGISAVRYGNIVGIHEIIVATQNQTITLKHEAFSRALFAEGALSALKFVIDKPVGLYDMKSLVAE